jgi:iron complex transport system ATP-binding protein
VLVQLSQAEQAPLLLLDEPTSAQDLAQQHQLLQMTKTFCKERAYAVLVIMHDLNLSLRYADRVGLLDKGSFVEIGKPELVLTPAAVEQHWGYRPQQVVTASGHSALI